MNQAIPTRTALQLSSQRLLLSPYEEANFADVVRILTDPLVIWWRDTAMSVPEARSFFDRTLAEQAAGLGLWLLHEPGGPLLGQALLKPLPSRREWIEVGYHLLPAARGKGFATEAAARLIAHGFHTLELDEICAIVLPVNQPSQKVMARLAMPRAGTTTHAGMLHDLYRLTRTEWVKRQQTDLARQSSR
jgi:RimJ/RimL family protein N-acetyltransferase